MRHNFLIAEVVARGTLHLHVLLIIIIISIRLKIKIHCRF